MDRIAPWLQTHWDRRAAGNFIGGGTGSGLAIVAAGMVFSGDAAGWTTFAMAAAFIAAGLSLVWLEIGRPWRFLHVFFNPQTSWMTREALIAPPLFVALGAAAWLRGTAAAGAVAILAFAFLYSQSRILRASTGIPAWREPHIVPLIIVTGLAEGAGGYVMLVTVLRAAAPSELAIVAAAILVAVRWLAWTAYRQRLAQGSAPTGARAALRAIGAPLSVGGTLAPLILFLGALVWPAASVALAPLGGLLSVAGGWLVKETIVTRAAFNQGFALPRLPVRNADAGAAQMAARPGWN